MIDRLPKEEVPYAQILDRILPKKLKHVHHRSDSDFLIELAATWNFLSDGRRGLACTRPNRHRPLITQPWIGIHNRCLLLPTV